MVAAVNDAPSLSGNLTLSAINEDFYTSAGQAFSDLLTSNNVQVIDPDTNAALTGFAVVTNSASATTQGVWQYSTNNGTDWLAIGEVTNANALILAPSALLRFVPVADFNGQPDALSIRVFDEVYQGSFTSGATRVTVDTQTHGATTAISE